jgi:hypothetical protein
MSWYVRKVSLRHLEMELPLMTTFQGDNVSKGVPVEMSWEFKQPEIHTRKDYTVTIFECTSDEAPTQKTNEVRECAVITFTAAGHNMVFQDGNEGQQQFRVVRFDVKMSLCGMGKVDFALYVNGRLAASRDRKQRIILPHQSLFTSLPMLEERLLNNVHLEIERSENFSPNVPDQFF